ncbi:molecular chaperone GrpE, partial [mine drainage metagenome]
MSDPAPEPPTAPPGPTPADAEPDWATRYKYLLADFENFRRRSERERESNSRQVRAALIRELLPIYEGFHFAREALQRLPPEDPVRTGLDLLHREWQTFLKHEGVEPVATPGARFESETQEAVGEVPAD